MSCFGPRKVVHSSRVAIGEVTVLLPLKRVDPLFDHDHIRDISHFQIACPVQITAKNLKKRISGKIQCVPAENIRLTFCGDVLKDDENVPLQVFENTEKVKEDVDVFRPRVVLTIRHPELVEQREDAKPIFGFLGAKGLVAKDLTPEEIEARDKAIEEEIERKRLEEEEDARLAEEEELRDQQRLELERDARRAREEAAALAFSNFDLRDELSKISCEMFFPQFRDHGFLDEGSFSVLTEEDLQSNIVIPRAARLRILALIDAVRRRLEMIAHQEAVTVAEQVQKSMLENNQMGTMAMGDGEAMDDFGDLELDEEEEEELAKANGYFTNKAQLNKAWSIKQKLLEKRRAKLAAMGTGPKEVPKKQHSNAISAKIAAIMRRCECDEFGVPKSSDYLLEKHFAMSTNPRILAKQLALELAAHRPHAHVDEVATTTSSKPPVGKPSAIDVRRHSAASLASSSSLSGPMRAPESTLTLKTKSSLALHAAPGDDVSVGSHSQTSSHHHHHHIHNIAAEEEAEFKEEPGDPKLAAAFHWKYEPDQPFCCDKHQREVEKLQQGFVLTRRNTNLSHIQVEIWKADTYKNGFVPRDMLRVLALEMLKQCRHYIALDNEPDTIFQAKKKEDGGAGEKAQTNAPEEKSTEARVEEMMAGFLNPSVAEAAMEAIVSENINTTETILADIEALLDSCIMTTANQIKLSQWSNPRERELKLCETIPFQQYDTQLFAYLLVNWIADLDVIRLIANAT